MIDKLQTMTKSKLVALLALALFVLPITTAQAQVRLDVQEGHFAPVAIALPTFFINNEGVKRYNNQQLVRNIIANNLDKSGLFKVNKPSLNTSARNSSTIPNFTTWKNYGVQILLIADIDLVAGQIEISYRLWDIITGAQLLVKKVTSSPEGLRRLAHIISDSIYQRMTGEPGYFDSRIAYVAESGPAGNRIEQIGLMDQDGFNHSYLTTGESKIGTVRFAPDGKKLIFTNIIDSVASVYLYDLVTRQTQPIGSYPGLTFSPSFEPSGTSILFTFAARGNSDIYRLDLNTGTSQRLTRYSGIDISASASPDGNKIVFNSDRGGSPQLYVMNRDGSNQQRISFGSGRYFTPVWSPRGDLIAFTLFRGGLFSIGVMKVDGSGERILSESYHDEGPSWAPNGRKLIFFRASPYQTNSVKTSQLFTIDVTGFNLHVLPTLGAAKLPDWSPLNRN